MIISCEEEDYDDDSDDVIFMILLLTIIIRVLTHQHNRSGRWRRKRGLGPYIRRCIHVVLSGSGGSWWTHSYRKDFSAGTTSALSMSVTKH